MPLPVRLWGFWTRLDELVSQHGRVAKRAQSKGVPLPRARPDRAAGHALGERPAPLRDCPVTRDPAGPDAADVFAHRGRFLRVLPETERSQTTVMAVAPGADDGPEEQHDGDQIMWSRAPPARAGAVRSCQIRRASRRVAGARTPAARRPRRASAFRARGGVRAAAPARAPPRAESARSSSRFPNRAPWRCAGRLRAPPFPPRSRSPVRARHAATRRLRPAPARSRVAHSGLRPA